MLMDQTQGSDMERLWALLTELSGQLSQNRQQTEELHRRADELKAQAVHTQTGFTLRRFNLDVSQEEFDSELEKMNVSLVLENQTLQQENRQLTSLLKDYEGTLEAVMGKFRAHAHATQQHHLDLIRHYESLLLSMPVTIPPPPEGATDPSNPEAPALDPLHLQLSLSHLASLLRKALRAMNGEDPEDSTSPLLQPQSVDGAIDSLTNHLSGLSLPRQRRGSDESISGFSSISSLSNLSAISLTPSDSISTAGDDPSSSSAASDSKPPSSSEESHLHALLASHHPSTSRTRPTESEGGYISRSATTAPHYLPTTSTSSLVGSPPKPGAPILERTAEELMRARGLGPLDEALQREAEVEALRRENEELKKALGIAGVDEEGEDGEGKREEKAKEDEGRGRAPLLPAPVSAAEPLKI
ncbi:hypothetical protein JCM6882_008554 [Rhodosporidiobolus microsporus]